MFCPPSPPASTGLQPPPSHSLLLLSPPSTIHHRHVRQVPRRLQSIQRCGEIQSKGFGVGKNQQGKS